MDLGWDRTLMVAAVLTLGLMAPTALALMVDGRTLNGIPVWIKPLKFQLSVGLYLLTLAWLFGALPEPAREGRAARILKRVALATGAFEIAYITLQAGQGLASHYNVGDAVPRLMYSLMGVAAVALTAVSPGLAVLLARHRPRHWSAAFRLSVVLGLVLTFVLGAGAGAVLSAGDGHWIGGVRTDVGGSPGPRVVSNGRRSAGSPLSGHPCPAGHPRGRPRGRDRGSAGAALRWRFGLPPPPIA